MGAALETYLELECSKNVTYNILYLSSSLVQVKLENEKGLIVSATYFML